jgi:alpha-L-fucosidase
MWDKPEADWQLADTYALIHRLQPAALIVPNHHGAPLPGEDVQTFEQDLPGATPRVSTLRPSAAYRSKRPSP